MDLRPIELQHQKAYDAAVTHVMQSWEWGEFRQKMGIKLKRYGLFENDKLKIAFQITFHKIPLTSLYVGYLPKGPLPDKDLARALQQIAKENNCAFIKLEPNVITNQDNPYQVYPAFLPSPKPLFTKHNFVLDLTPTEEQLLQNMHQKTRYNIRLAEKKGVQVKIRTDDEGFKDYLKLYFETTARQGFYGHNEEYHWTVWKTLRTKDMVRVLIAYYDGQPLTAWELVNFKDTLYYPYGGSSNLHRDTMHSNLVAWEAIKLGQQMNLKKFDMWGSLGPDADPKDSYYGFHRFKQGYGGELVQYIGTYDLVADQQVYMLFNWIDKFTALKVALLKLLNK